MRRALLLVVALASCTTSNPCFHSTRAECLEGEPRDDGTLPDFGPPADLMWTIVVDDQGTVMRCGGLGDYCCPDMKCKPPLQCNAFVGNCLHP